MSSTALSAWVLVALLGVMTPGADTLLVLRSTLLRGRPAGLATITGIVVGCLAWATASLVGLTALLAASELAYNIVRLLGAAYLIWLGATAIWKTLPRNRAPAAAFDEWGTCAVEGATDWWDGLRSGAVTNLLNPKAGVFYISLLPQFMPAGPGATSWGVLLVAIHVAVCWLWYPLIVWAATMARGWLLREHVRRSMDRISAAVLIGLGVTLAVERA